MTVGWVEIVVDGKPAWVRICYVNAWNDPAWRKVNGLPSKRNPRVARLTPERPADEVDG